MIRLQSYLHAWKAINKPRHIPTCLKTINKLRHLPTLSCLGGNFVNTVLVFQFKKWFLEASIKKGPRLFSTPSKSTCDTKGMLPYFRHYKSSFSCQVSIWNYNNPTPNTELSAFFFISWYTGNWVSACLSLCVTSIQLLLASEYWLQYLITTSD